MGKRYGDAASRREAIIDADRYTTTLKYAKRKITKQKKGDADCQKEK
jgi:hypothetical protein